MKKLFWTLAAAGAAACGGGEADQPTQTRKVVASSPLVDQLRGLSEMNRGLALRRAIQDSGKRCKRVDASGFQQDYQNLSMWTARCSDTGGWALFIAPNGDVQVRDCDDASRLGLPACRFERAAEEDDAAK